jgi:eukaryotic-like serine/threonine-protein kinase
VYEFFDAEPLDSIIRAGTALTFLQKLDIVLQVSEALQYAHAKGIVHRNVKPHNIMLLRDGKVKLVGFEMAYGPGDANRRGTGKLAGTLLFMAPETLRGQPIDRRTDIFSLGVTFYQLVEGELPFQGESTRDLLGEILDESTPRSRQAHDLRLPELQAIFDKALAKQKDARYQSCSEFSEDILRLRRRLKPEA